MSLETKFVELPKITLPPSAKQEVPITFDRASKLVEIHHSRGVKVNKVSVAGKIFEADKYANEVVPAGAPVLVEIENERTESTDVRGGIYVEQEVKAVAVPPPSPVVSPVASAGAGPGMMLGLAGVAQVPASQALPASLQNDPNAPPPPGSAKHISLPGQQITVTTPGGNGGGANGGLHQHGGVPGHIMPQGQPPLTGGVQSFDLGNQKITVTAPPQARGSHPGSQVIAPVIQARVSEGPSQVFVGTDMVGVLLKKTEAQWVIEMLRGAVHHPGYCSPIEGAIQRGLSETTCPAQLFVGTDEVAIVLRRSEAEWLVTMLNGAPLQPGFCFPIEGAVRRAMGEI